METKGEIKWSRWKPTKRQKEILEELFRQGNCNPSRSHIDEITNLLKQHGIKECVNYWFQNSHVRNKRKHKKETHQMQQSPSESTLPQHQNTQGTHQM